MKNHLVIELALILFGTLLLIILIGFSELGLATLVAIPQAVLGLGYVLFMPGYTLQSLLFPRRSDLDNTERIALSFALSGACVPLIALLLNALPWGIRLWSVVLSMSLLIVLSATTSFLVRLRLPGGQAFDPLSRQDISRWWARQERTNRIVYGLLAAILLVASVTALSIVFIPKPAEFFTEFFILNQAGLAEDYPRQAAPGETLQVSMGITNRERTAQVYRVEVWAQDGWDATRRQQVGAFGPYELAVGEEITASLTWQMPWAGEDQQVEFQLFLGTEPEPYRTLSLWLDVTATP